MEETIMAKKALLVGIDAYPPPNTLYECVNDVTNMRDILIKYYGFEVDNIRVLTDARATKQGIFDRLHWLIQDAALGDKLVFHYSGHGSQIRDLDQDERKDHLDELICPVNMTWDDNFITDDELATLIKDVPANCLEVLMDCCHSATMTRNSMIARKGEDYPKKVRFMRPPIDLQCRIDPDMDYPVKRFKKATKGTAHILFAACKDYQTAADGAFTPAFCKHVRDTNGKVTRRTLLSRIRATLRFNQFDQYPELESDRDSKFKEVFS
jgi:metacaspase-1